MCKPVHTYNKLLRPVFKLAGVISCKGKYLPLWETRADPPLEPGDDIMRDWKHNCRLKSLLLFR